MGGVSFGELQCRRFPPDGDVERWVRDGPPGHVEYHGGPVEWDEPVVSSQDQEQGVV